MASDQESCSDEEPDSEMMSDDLCLPDSDDEARQVRNLQVCQLLLKNVNLLSNDVNLLFL